MPTQAAYRVGILINVFQTYGGPVAFNPDQFLQKTKPLSPTGQGGVKAPTAPDSVMVALGSKTDADFVKSGAGVYGYTVTAANRFSESVPMEASTTVSLAADDLAKGIKVTMWNAAAMVGPEWFNVYRTRRMAASSSSSRAFPRRA